MEPNTSVAAKTNTGQSNSKQPWPGAFNVVKPAFLALKVNLGLVAAYAILQGLLKLAGPDNNATQNLTSTGAAMDYSNLLAAAGVGSVGLIIGLLLLVAVPKLQLASAEGKEISLGDLLRTSVSKLLPALALAILAGLAILIGLLLLIVPGLVLLTWFIFAMYILVDKGTGPIESLKQSRELARGNAGKIWGVIGVSILVSIVAGLLTGWIPFVGGAVAGVIGLATGVMMVFLYRNLQSVKAPVVSDPTAAATETA